MHTNKHIDYNHHTIFFKLLCNFPGQICSYKVESDLDPFPFSIEVLNKTTGEVELTLNQDADILNCAETPQIKFFISAVDCGTGNNQNQLESIK